MKKLNRSFLAAALTAGALLVTTHTQAQGILKITEVQSSESTNGAALPTADWFELSNVGNAAVTLTGYTVDDDSNKFSKSVPLLGITSIGAGESVVFFEATDGLTISQFQSWWGSSLNPALQIGTYSGSGVGLGAGGDEVHIFDSAGNPIDGVILGAATTGVSFLFDTSASGRSSIGLSQVGVGGAFTSQNGDIGSPGVVNAVPEPSTFALAGASLAMLAGFRRWQNHKA